MTDTQTKNAILVLEERRRLAMLQADVAALDVLFDDGLIYQHSTGIRDNKTSYLDKLGTGRLRYQAISLIGQTVVRVNNCCLVDGLMDATVLRATGTAQVSSRYVALWLYAGDVWRLLMVHAEPISVLSA